MKILGVDPGINATGFGLIEDGKLLEYGLIQPPRIPTPERIYELYKEFKAIIERTSPDVAAVEEIVFNKNPRSFYLLGTARGVVLLALAERGIKVVEVPPTRVKLAITGNGRAKKRQVAFMVKKLLNIEEELSEHITDALACALVLARERNVILDKR